MQELKPIFKRENINKKDIILYCLSFLITFGILFSFHTYYKAGYGNPLTGCLSLSNILLNGVASVCALFYLRNTNMFALSKPFWQLLLAIAYGMSSYGVVQESLAAALCLYGFFPILFLTYENMITGKNHLPFIITMALALMIHPEGAIPVFFLLVILSVFDLILQKKLSLGNYMHVFSCLVLSFLLSCFRILPYLESMYPATYEGYGTSYPLLMILTRFLPFGIPSISFGTSNGMDVYLGFFLLILVFMFFTSTKISGAKKIAYGFFAILTLAVITVSPLRFLFLLFTESGRYTVFCSFFIIFWLFRLAGEAASVLETSTWQELLKASCLTLALVTVSLFTYRHNFTSFGFPVMFALLVLYSCLLFSLLKHKKTFSLPVFFLFLLLFLELSVNTMVSTNLNFYPGQRNVTASYIWNNWKSQAPDTAADAADTANAATDTEVSPYQDMNLYNEFISTHRDQKDFKLLDQLLAGVTLEASEYEELCGTDLPDILMEINGIARKLGCKDAIFTPASISVAFEESEEYSISELSDQIYYFYGDQSENRSLYYIAPVQITYNGDATGDLYILSDATNEVYTYNKDELNAPLNGYTFLSNNKGYGASFRIVAYTLNQEALQKASYLLENYNDNSSSASQPNFVLVYGGIVLSCLGLLIFLSLYFNSDKEKVYKFLFNIKEKLSMWMLPKKIVSHTKGNRVYYLAFFIPVIVFLITMVVTDCTPFGASSFFSGDGTALTLPSYWDCYYNLKAGNTYLTLNGGYGTSQYASHPFIGLLSFLCLFKVNQIPAILLLLEAVCLGLCSFAMVFYMTHRLNGKAAKKTDYRLLVSALIYSMNAYMVAMHDFTSWYYALLAFPLLMAAFEYMVYKKKTLPYVLLLTFCITSNLYLALYMCIFLVIYFFTCHFDGIKDFFAKGVRFALCSILAAGNSFFIISNTLLSSSDSLYRDSDSVFPAFGLHTNFLEQWKQQMIFSVTHSVTNDNGKANIYFGIVTLFFLLIYFCAKEYRVKDKLRKIIPIGILYISFNEQVLSYLWNGFHYQTKVPNRFVFLLMFLVAVIAYDGICQIRKVSAVKFVGITVVISTFFAACQFGTSGSQTISWISSFAICAICLICFFLFKKRKSVWLTRSMMLVLILELSVNCVYSISNVGLNTMLLYGNYPETTAYINGLEEDSEYFRSVFPATVNALTNSGSVLDTHSTDLFNSFVTAHQNNLNTLLGFYSNGNIVKNQNNSTPFGVSLAGARYIFLSTKLIRNIKNLSYYNYLGKKDIFYIFENPNALSLGFYVPDKMLDLDVSVDDPVKFSNDFVSTFLEENVEVLIPQQIKYSSDTTAENSFIFTDARGNMMEVEKAYEYYSADDDTSNISDLHLRINFTSKKNGLSYLYAKEFAGIGETEAGKAQVFDIAFPNQLTDFASEFQVATLDEEVLNSFCTTVKENQVENIVTGNDTITGTTNYAKDGYTMFSLAYDKGFHAYIDGEEVPIEDPYDAMMFIKTPAGKHTITLKYVPYGMHTSRFITFVFWGITLVASLLPLRKRRIKPETKTN